MITYEKALEMIEFQKQQISDLTAERDRLKAESANASDALSVSHINNAELINQNQELEQEIADIVEEVYNSDLEMIGE